MNSDVARLMKDHKQSFEWTTYAIVKLFSEGYSFEPQSLVKPSVQPCMSLQYSLFKTILPLTIHST